MSNDKNLVKEQTKTKQIDDSSLAPFGEDIFEQAKSGSAPQSSKDNVEVVENNNNSTAVENAKKPKTKQNKKSVYGKEESPKKKKIEAKFIERRKCSKWPLLTVVVFLVVGIFGAMFSVQKFYAERDRNKETLASELSNLEKRMTANFEIKLAEIKTGSIVNLKKMIVSQGLNIEGQQSQIDEITNAKKSAEGGGEKTYFELQSVKKELESKNTQLESLQNQIFHLQSKMRTVDFDKLSKMDFSKFVKVESPKRTLAVKSPAKKIKPKYKAPQAKTLYSIDGFTLYSIDMFGNEKIAVFTKNLVSQKVRIDESFKGYSINSILTNSGVVYFTKGNKRYSMRVKS